MLVADNDEYVRSVLRKALGDEKAELLLDRIMQSGDVSGIESLKWMEPNAVAELLRNEHPQIVAAIMVHLEVDQAAAIALVGQRGGGAGGRHSRLLRDDPFV